MKHILVLGAGQSAPYLIKYLLNAAGNNGWFVTVGDLNPEAARRAVNNHPCGSGIPFDINDAAMRSTHFQKADLVVNMLSPVFQHLVALECLNCGSHVVSASYQDKKVEAMNPDANRRGILILNEMGLDPGIDHMSAMKLIDTVRRGGGLITSFLSYGSGLPAPEVNSNPLRYAITWNPRNIVRAGEAGALYMEQSKLKVLAHNHVFQRTWAVDVEGIGMLEAYPNRNSLVYRDVFGLKNVKTMIRGTLRYPGWSETWHEIVRIGLPNDSMPVPGLAHMTYREFLQMFLPLHASGARLEHRVANLLQINPTGRIMENLKWLGLFSDEVIGNNARTAADVMTHLLVKKLPLPANARDMVVLQHELEVTYPKDAQRRERIISTMIEFGEPGGLTAMSKAVGLPAAIAAKLILLDQLPLTGCLIPTQSAIYEPILTELNEVGITFKEQVTPLS